MKFRRLFFAAVFLLISWQNLLSQEKGGNLILLHSFSDASYELIAAITDNLITGISQHPNAVGYVVLYGGADKIQNAFYKQAISRSIKFRGFPEDKILFINSTNLEKARIELWLSKNGEKPAVKEKNENLVLPETAGAINFVEDVIQITEINGKATFYLTGCEFGCVPYLDFYLLSDFLNANPQKKAFVIVHGKNFKNALHVKDILAKAATEAAGISTARLNFLFGGKNKIESNQFSEVVVYLADDVSQLPKSIKRYRPL